MDGISVSTISSTLMAKHVKQNQLWLKPIQLRRKNIDNKINAWGKIRSSLKTLLEKSNAIKDETFHAIKISENKAFDTHSSVTSGTYNIKVNELAKNHTLSFQTRKGIDTLLGNKAANRTLKISQKGKNNESKEDCIILTQQETSLIGITKAINNQKNGIHAEIKNVDNEGTLRLILRAEKSGSAGEMTISVDGDDMLNNIMKYDPKSSKIDSNNFNEKMKQDLEAANARIVINGNEYIRSSNNINDILNGITLTLKQKSKPDELETLTLNPDERSMQKAIEEFITAFNDFITQSVSLSKFRPANYSNLKLKYVTSSDMINGPLAGENLLSRLKTIIRHDVGANYGNDIISSITDLGIRVDTNTGILELDKTKLKNIIHSNPEEVKKLLITTEEKSSMLNVLINHIKNYIGNIGNNNYIKNEIEKLENQKKEIEEKLERIQNIINTKMQVYQQQYQRMEILLAQLESLQTSIITMQSISK